MGAITVIVPRGEEQLAVTVPQLQSAALAITRRLGYEPTARGMQRRSEPRTR